MARNTPDFEALTEEWDPQIRRAFLQSVDEITDRAKIKEITRLLERGQVDDVLDVLGIDERAFQRLGMTMEQMYASSGIRFGNSILTRARWQFDVRNPQAERWVRERSSSLVTEITQDQRNMVREFLERGLNQGDNPRTSALNLVGRVNPTTGRRQGGVIGLTTQQEAFQRRYAEELASSDPTALRKAMKRGLRDKRFDRSILKAIRDGKHLPPETQSKMRAAYRNRMRKYRADTISRTETLQSLAAAQHEAYRQAIEAGELEADQVTKIWKSAADGRVRFSHAVLHNNERPFLEPFLSPYGSLLRYPGDFGLGAKAKDVIQCRCIVHYRVDFRPTVCTAGAKGIVRDDRFAGFGQGP